MPWWYVLIISPTWAWHNAHYVLAFVRWYSSDLFLGPLGVISLRFPKKTDQAGSHFHKNSPTWAWHNAHYVLPFVRFYFFELLLGPL